MDGNRKETSAQLSDIIVVTGDGATFVGNKSIATGTTEDDVYTGATGNKEVIRYKAQSTDSMLGDAEKQVGWGYVQGDGTSKVETTVTFPTAFLSPPIVVMNFIGLVATSGGTPTGPGSFVTEITTTNAVIPSPTDATTTTFLANLNRTGGSTIDSGFYAGFTFIAVGPVASDASE